MCLPRFVNSFSGWTLIDDDRPLNKKFKMKLLKLSVSHFTVLWAHHQQSRLNIEWLNRNAKPLTVDY
uniref:Uncharacterized protein n=1 Tax=Tetranychus urticae TaxID=32264 RepID=T1KTS9_TETUR